MAFPYGRQEHYSPLGAGEEAFYASPAPIQQQWTSSNSGMGFGSPEIEMQPGGRPHPMHRTSANSFASVASHSTLFPSNQTTPQLHESQSFLTDPANKLDITSFVDPEYKPFNDNTARQFWYLVIKSLARWFITAGLCAGYVMSTIIWSNKPAISENQKKIYNAITTAISIALGLNIASAFKDMALNMRWPILASKKRPLRQVDLLLRADSLSELFRLVFIVRKFWVIVACLAWLFINILAQAGIAMLNLTYGFDVNYNAVLLGPGQVQLANMDHFFPGGNNSDPSQQDEEYTAHLYGGLADTYYLTGSILDKPKPGDIYKSQNPMLWDDHSNSYLEFVFSDEPVDQALHNTFAAYTSRTVNITYTCESHEVTAGGDGTSNEIEVANIGNVSVNSVVPDSITYFTNLDNFCTKENTRCSIVEAFEASTLATPYYYKCNLTMGSTQNDYANVSYISDNMAYYATSAIAQIGYIDAWGQEYQIYPNKSTWGRPAGGNGDAMGLRMASFALGSIAGATLFNPVKYHYGTAPTQAFSLNLNHPYFFYVIIGLIAGCQLLFVVVVAVWANTVKVGPDGHLAMSLLLRPIADSLEGVSGGLENKAYKRAKEEYSVKYEQSRTGRWVLSMAG